MSIWLLILTFLGQQFANSHANHVDTQKTKVQLMQQLCTSSDGPKDCEPLELYLEEGLHHDKTTRKTKPEIQESEPKTEPAGKDQQDTQANAK